MLKVSNAYWIDSHLDRLTGRKNETPGKAWQAKKKSVGRDCRTGANGLF